MTAPIFVDTNVFIYALDDGNRAKQKVAQLWRATLWENRLGRTSFQVLEEFYVKVSKKLPAARELARAEVRDLLAWQPVKVDAEIMERAWKIQDRYKISYWDALIVAAAKATACHYLLTEDLQADQNLDGVRVLSPFLSTPDSLPGN